MSSLDSRPWYAEPAVLPADCPEPGCPYSINVCPGHVQRTWCDECQDWTPTREGPLWRSICDECSTDREPE